MQIIERENLTALFESLKKHGYEIVGPTVRDEVVIYDTLNAVEDLPKGWTDEQEKGIYRLKKRDDEALFGYVLSPHTWKKFLYPPKVKLWEAKRQEKSFTITEPQGDGPKYAFLGVRACELAAIAMQDKIFLEGAHIDPIYKERREKSLIIAVNCGQAAKTCFCPSMNSGPKVTSGFDLALTEVCTPYHHYFVVETGTAKGKDVLKDLSLHPAEESAKESARQVVKNAEDQIERTLKTEGLKENLQANAEHPRWNDVADRCLSCANCTMVCPTCFCSTVEDVTDLTGDHAERWRLWDSCFTMDFSHIHGGNIRSSTKGRYRQWMTHKLASWVDQFGVSGCTGCGRCITWCPVGIDITEEVAVIQKQE